MAMRRKAAMALVLALVSLLGERLEAQSHRFKIGGGGGFSSLEHPELKLGRSGTLGGFFGVRFTDNFSLESGFSFARSNRQFSEEGQPVDEVQAIPAFQFESNRYDLDGSFVVNLGRRQPFHVFLLGGGGLVRRDEKRTDFVFSPPDEETGQVAIIDRIISVDTVVYEPTFHFGAGFDLYFMYNVAARVEFRWRFPQDRTRESRMYLFGASYFF